MILEYSLFIIYLRIRNMRRITFFVQITENKKSSRVCLRFLLYLFLLKSARTRVPELYSLYFCTFFFYGFV